MKRLNQNGAVAILTVVIFSLIVTIVVTVYARITVAEHQESITYDLSTRALYAAEAGVQDAITSIRGTPAIKANGRPDDCKQNPADTNFGKIAASGNLAYTCQLIDVNPEDVVASLNTQKATLFKLEPKNPVGSADDLSIEVAWSKSGDSNLQPRDDSSKLFPQTSRWVNSGGEQIHPLLRVTAIRILGKATGRTKFSQNTFFLNPTEDRFKSTIDTLGFGPYFTEYRQSADSVIQNASCVSSSVSTADGYSCRWQYRINPLDLRQTLFTAGEEANSIYLSISSEYGATDFKVRLLNGADDVLDPIELQKSQANIDVTARAGSVFRRVQQRIPLDNNFAQVNFGADALVVGKGICKNFKITDTSVGFSDDFKCP